VLSGDVHHGEILDPFPNTADHSAFLEVTSSGLTHECSRGIYGALCQPLLERYHKHRFVSSNDNPQSKPNYYIGRNYGTVSIDWERDTVEVKVHEVVIGTVVLTTGARPFRSTQAADILATASHVLPCMDGHLVPVAYTALLTVALLLAGGRLLRSKTKRNSNKVLSNK